MASAERDALMALLKETRGHRMADRLPEERRPRGGLLISIGMDGGAGMTPGEEEAALEMEEAEAEDDPLYDDE